MFREGIGWFELGKTLYSVSLLHSGRFRSVVGPWFFIFLKGFHVKIWCHCLFLSFSTLWFIFSFWYHWLLGHIWWMEDIWAEISVIIQSCLSHIPSYFLSLFKIPASMAIKIERLQRDFLWSGVGECKRDHLISWDVVCKLKAKGGLGRFL